MAKVKVPRPKVKGLRQIYKGLRTVSVANRIASLAYALQWYDGAVPYIVSKKKLTTELQKKLETAVKCRKQGIGTNQEGEKETSFRMALKAYEKACAYLKPPPVEKAYEVFERSKARLEKKQGRLEQRFGLAVGLLQKAFGNKVELMVADAVKERQFEPTLRKLTYNREAAKQLGTAIREHGILPVLVKELPVLTRYACLEADGKGGWTLNLEKQVATYQAALEEFVRFAGTTEAPKKLLRVGVARAPKAPGQKRVGGPVGRRGAKGPLLEGFLVPGTAIAMVYERLKDEKEHDLTEVTKDVQSADPVGRVKQLGRYGTQKGLWAVEFNGDKVRLVRVAAGGAV